MARASNPSWFLVALALAQFVAPAVAWAADAPAPQLRLAQTVRTYNLTLPLIFQGAYLGDVPVAASPDGNIAVNVDRFVGLLGERLDPTMTAKLKELSKGQQIIDIAAFAPAGITIAYDSASLELKVTIPVALQGGQALSALDQQEGPRKSAATIAPEPFSASLTLTLRQSYAWSPDSDRGFDPFRASGDFAANLFGDAGFYLFAQGEYDEAANDPFHRGNAVLIYDDTEEALRYGFGDVSATPAGFQASPLLGGLSFQRQFGELQPFRNVRPSGLFRFSLDRASTVDVVVNGSTIRTLRLDAGQYDLKDFPLFNGLNDVELYVVDEFGRRLIAAFSQFFSARLLNPGIAEFGATLGLPQTRSSGDTITYDDSNLVFSGYARYGLLQDLTLGVNLQMDRNQWLAGGEAGYASPIGTFGAVFGLSDIDAIGSGHSVLVSYEATARELGPMKNPQVNLSWQQTSENFASLGTTTPSEPLAWEMRGRFSAQLPLNLGLGLSASFAEGRDTAADETRYGLSLSHRIAGFDVSASGERTERAGDEADNRLLLSLSLPLSDRDNLRTSFDSQNDQYLADYTRYQRNELNDYGLRASLLRDNDRVTGTGEFALNANRFALLVQHDAISDSALSGIQAQRSSYTLGTQIALAGDEIAIGRPVGQRFAIVRAHESLAGTPVGVSQSRGATAREVETDFLGPALVSAGGAYQPQSVFIDVENLPSTYNVGTGQYELFPGPASGYAVMIGSESSISVLGLLQGADGKPLALLGGEVRSVDNPDFKPVLVFTNSVGKFFAEGLAPGRYQMVLGPAMDIVVPLEVPTGSNGVVNAGTITVQEPST
jgi:outer membrane usher protein